MEHVRVGALRVAIREISREAGQLFVGDGRAL
jgi:hypothetical protein